MDAFGLLVVFLLALAGGFLVGADAGRRWARQADPHNDVSRWWDPTDEAGA